jgi:glycosyltransferase involved in cell wall biosynthesis
MKKVDKIIVQNSLTKSFLVDRGIVSNKIIINYGGVDRSIFYPGKIKKEYVLISGDFKYRKNPQGVISVIEFNTDINFIIHGKNLTLFDCIKDLPNVTLINWDQQLQPILMREARLFLNLSILEGGPISILEALASGTPVIATDTGIARDVIRESSGSIVPVTFCQNKLRSELKKWLELSSRNMSKDFLNGENSFENYAKDLFT